MTLYTDHTLTLQGCDDHTSITIRVTERQKAMLDTIAETVNARSRTTCNPTMRFEVGAYVCEDCRDDDHESHSAEWAGACVGCACPVVVTT